MPSKCPEEPFAENKKNTFVQRRNLLCFLDLMRQVFGFLAKKVYSLKNIQSFQRYKLSVLPKLLITFLDKTVFFVIFGRRANFFLIWQKVFSVAFWNCFLRVQRNFLKSIFFVEKHNFHLFGTVVEEVKYFWLLWWKTLAAL